MRSNELALNMDCFLLLMGLVRPDARLTIKAYKEMIEKIGKEGLFPDFNNYSARYSDDGIELRSLLENELAQQEFLDFKSVTLLCELSTPEVAVPGLEIPYMTTELAIMTDSPKHTQDVCLGFEPPIMFKRVSGDEDWELSDFGTELGIDNRKNIRCFMQLAEVFPELRELKCGETAKVTHDRAIEIITAFAKMVIEYKASLTQG